MEIQKHTDSILKGVQNIIENAQKKVAVFLNAETTLLYWQIGNYINQQLIHENRADYGAKIIATLSQQLTTQYGKGYTYTALTRMCKVSKIFNSEIIATLSQQLSWSHLIELAAIENETKRDFFTQLCVYERWGIRELREKADTMLFERTAIATKPEETIKQALQNLKQGKALAPELVFKNSYVLDFLNLPSDYSEEELETALINNLQQFILELGNGFAFIERQKRIPIDADDYHLDLLFYHRKLKRLVAIDLKLGKFKPKYKSQMELYLRWLEKYDMQAGEEKPIGLLLCSEGNTEHIELLMLDEKEIRVAQYLTELPSKEWFADKLHRALEIAKMNTTDK
ncbi:MAG: PDDEXK nuclease domain-containing protein [Bacteroidales bacterium]|jgi:predicted nuclease of restriction endonuclease-like (RecB) superfamily